MTIHPTESDRARLDRRLELVPETGCRLWTGKRTKYGHGQIQIGSRKDGSRAAVHTHRLAWALAGRDLPQGYELTHHCPGGDRPACCEVSHLKLLTPVQHGRDRAIKGQGPRSKTGLPYGVRLQSGRYQSRLLRYGVNFSFGTYDTWAEASAVALYHRNVMLMEAASRELPDASGGRR